MSSDTQQWVYKLGAVTAALCLFGCFITMFISIFYFGDGEGLRILSGLTGPILGILGSAAALMAPHSISSALASFRTTVTSAVSPTPGASIVTAQPGEPTSSPAGLSSASADASVTGTGV